MTFNQLFKKRMSSYYKNILKYSRYVLNDSFLIALILIIGAGGFGYSNYVNSLNPDAILPSVIMIVILSLVLQVGRTALFLEPADTVYILPKEKAYIKLLKRLNIRSFLFHLIPLFVAAMVSMPLFVRTNLMNYSDWVLLFLSLAGWKWGFLSICLYYLKIRVTINPLFSHLIYFIFSFLGILLTVFISPLIGLGAALLAVLVTYPLFYLKKNDEVFLNWEKMIQVEQSRKQVIYRFFNMFTDVPFITTKTKRFAFLDPIMNWIPSKNISAQEYYLKRVFVRNTTYSGLVLRLVIIGGLILAFTDNLVLNFAVSLLFNYLIAFQLIPLSKHLSQTVQFRFHPVHDLDNTRSVRNIILYISVVVTIIFTIIEIPSGFQAVFGVGGLNILFSVLFSYYYVPKKIIKG